MLTYKCNVIDISGKRHNVSRAADSPKDVIEYFKLNKFTVVEIKDRGNIDLGKFI